MTGVRQTIFTAVAVFFATVVSAAGIELPEYERVELPNGAVLLLSEKHDVPLIGMRAVLRGGAVVDPEDRGGLSGLFAGLLEYGAGALQTVTYKLF